jgi:hypothetical protein
MIRTSESKDLKARLARMKRLMAALDEACSETERQRDVTNRLLHELDSTQPQALRFGRTIER